MGRRRFSDSDESSSSSSSTSSTSSFEEGSQVLSPFGVRRTISKGSIFDKALNVFERQWEKLWFRFLFLFFIRCFYIVDMGTDIFVLTSLNENEDPFWFSVTLMLILTPSFVAWMLGWVYCVRKKMFGSDGWTPLRILCYALFGLFFPVMADLLLVTWYMFPPREPKSRGVTRPIYYYERVREVVEPVFESLPQAAFQLYIASREGEISSNVTALTFSIVVSIGSVCKAIIISYMNGHPLRWLQSILTFGVGGLPKLEEVRQGLVESLELSSHPMSVTMLKTLLAAFKDPRCRVRDLIMSDCGIGSEEVKVLEEILKSSQSLDTLILNDNPLGDEGVSRLAKSLKYVKGASFISFRGCGLTFEGEAELQKAWESVGGRGDLYV